MEVDEVPGVRSRPNAADILEGAHTVGPLILGIEAMLKSRLGWLHRWPLPRFHLLTRRMRPGPG